MHLDRAAIDAWADRGRRVGVTLILLDDGDTCPLHQHGNPTAIGGPAIVELVVYRGGGWSAREAQYETPASIVAGGRS